MSRPLEPRQTFAGFLAMGDPHVRQLHTVVPGAANPLDILEQIVPPTTGSSTAAPMRRWLPRRLALVDYGLYFNCRTNQRHALHLHVRPEGAREAACRPL